VADAARGDETGNHGTCGHRGREVVKAAAHYIRYTLLDCHLTCDTAEQKMAAYGERQGRSWASGGRPVFLVAYVPDQTIVGADGPQPPPESVRADPIAGEFVTETLLEYDGGRSPCQLAKAKAKASS
jgi:hypothetical protein